MEEQRIVAFSGRSESGKDTVAKMIQYRIASVREEYYGAPYYPTLEQFLSGKDVYSENYVKETQESVTQDSDWQIKKFSYKLKQVASLLTGIPVEKFEDQEVKKSLLGAEWGTIKDVPLNAIEPFKDVDFNVLMDVRTFLQKLGTDAIRDNLHSNTWINALWCDYRPEEKWLITDCRFKNEFESIKQRGGIVVRLTRNSDVVSTHVSETELDDYNFDYIIDNKNDTLEETYEKVKEFCRRYNLI